VSNTHSTDGGSAYGGAIAARDGGVFATQCTFSKCICVGGNGAEAPIGSTGGPGGDAFGGAIYATNSRINLGAVIFADNLAQGGAFAHITLSTGGGSGLGGALAFERSSGAISNVITRCIFSGNRALGDTKSTANISRTDAYGGGLYLGAGSMRIEDTLFTNNLALGGPGWDKAGFAYCGNGLGGGAYNAGALDIWNSALVSNRAIGGDLDESCCRNGGGLAGNGSGGAIYNQSILSLINSTLSGNSVKGGAPVKLGEAGSGDGGAILNEGAAALLNVTVAANSALPAAPMQLPVQVRGGALCVPGGSITMTNTILYSLAGQTNVAGTIRDGGHNISSDASAGFDSVSSKNNTDPQLAALGNNGGFTPTLALLFGSPAINAADVAACPSTDQRGFGRPMGASCDIGAFEFAPKLTLAWLTAGAVRLEYQFEAGQTYSVSGSTNLIDWEILGAKVSDANGKFQFDDTNSVDFRSRFYKVLP
jgi:hypothetical protein